MVQKMINTNDINALIAFAVQNNRQGVIIALNSLGYVIGQNISDDDLFTLMLNIYTSHGLTELQAILNRVPFDKFKISLMEAKNLSIKYNNTPEDGNARFGDKDWWKNLGNNIGDLLSGVTTVTSVPPVINTSSTSPISATQIMIVAGVAIAAIVILAIVFRK